MHPRDPDPSPTARRTHPRRLSGEWSRPGQRRRTPPIEATEQPLAVSTSPTAIGRLPSPPETEERTHRGQSHSVESKLATVGCDSGNGPPDESASRLRSGPSAVPAPSPGRLRWCHRTFGSVRRRCHARPGSRGGRTPPGRRCSGAWSKQQGVEPAWYFCSPVPRREWHDDDRGVDALISQLALHSTRIAERLHPVHRDRFAPARRDPDEHDASDQLPPQPSSPSRGLDAAKATSSIRPPGAASARVVSSQPSVPACRSWCEHPSSRRSLGGFTELSAKSPRCPSSASGTQPVPGSVRRPPRRY